MMQNVQKLHKDFMELAETPKVPKNYLTQSKPEGHKAHCKNVVGE